LVSAPDEYLDLVLIPAMLHIDPLVFMEYPPAMRYQIRTLLMHYIAAGGMAHGG
jgi:hypothetical protein